jgi:hypothetical protein
MYFPPNFRLVPQEAGGKSSRNQGFTMFSVSGDVVQLEFSIDAVSASTNCDPVVFSEF